MPKLAQKNQKKSSSEFSILDAPFSIKFSMVMALLVSFLLPLLLLSPLLIIHMLGFPVSRLGLSAENFGGFALVVQIVALLISLIIIAKKLRQEDESWVSVGLKKFKVFQAVRFVIGYYLIIVGLMILLAILFSAIGAGVSDAADNPNSGSKIVTLFGGFGLAFVAAVIFAPIIEEIVFRGMLLPAFAKRYGFRTGAVASSVVFMLVHLNPITMISALPLGIYLAIMYKRTNSIYPGMILHASWNLMVLLLAKAAV